MKTQVRVCHTEAEANRALKEEGPAWKLDHTHLFWNGRSTVPQVTFVLTRKVMR